MTSISTTRVYDGYEEDTIAPGVSRSDVVLVDAPCSGFGSLRRNPDLKWLPGRERQALAAVTPSTMDFKFDAERDLLQPSVAAAVEVHPQDEADALARRNRGRNTNRAQVIAPPPPSLAQGSGSGGWSHTTRHMATVQSRLLDTYSTLVKPGGRLVYGVCTFAADETTGVVQNFLQKHPEFTMGPGGYLGI